MKYLLAIVYLFLIFLSCSNEDLYCDLPPPTNYGFEIGFSNSEGIPLINNEYKQDSFKLWNNDKTLFLKLSNFGIGGDSTRLTIRYSEIENNKNYWLELDTNVVDTLNFNFEFIERDGEGCSYYQMLEVTHNGELYPLTNSSEGVFILIKD